MGAADGEDEDAGKHQQRGNEQDENPVVYRAGGPRAGLRRLLVAERAGLGEGGRTCQRDAEHTKKSSRNRFGNSSHHPHKNPQCIAELPRRRLSGKKKIQIIITQNMNAGTSHKTKINFSYFRCMK